MTFSSTRLAGLLLAAFATATPCLAESFASSAASAGSASLGSVSDSLRGSSNSSTRNTEVTEGDYRIIEVGEVAGRPGLLRLKMQAAAPSSEDGELWLDVPQQALATRALSPGDVVSAHRRPYGYEFAHADTRETFFLVLADDWLRELDSHAVAF